MNLNVRILDWPWIVSSELPEVTDGPMTSLLPLVQMKTQAETP